MRLFIAPSPTTLSPVTVPAADALKEGVKPSPVTWTHSGLLCALCLFFSDANPLFSFWFPWEVILVLLFHELGHFAAAKAVGWTPSPPLLVPYLGGAVLIEELASVSCRWRTAAVILAGPAPGLIIGGLCLTLPAIAGHLEGRWFSAAFALVFINLFNLLPFFPLDGGRLLFLFVKEGRLRTCLEYTGLFFVGLIVLSTFWVFFKYGF